jgi:hypothetical protein
MNENQPILFFEQYLTDRREKVLDDWLSRLTPEEQFLLVEMAGNARLGLTQYFDEVTHQLAGRLVRIPPFPGKALPVREVKAEVSILVKGRGALLEQINHWTSWRNLDWFRMRRKVNRAFHALLRKNSKTACDCCRETLDRQMTEISNLEKDLKAGLQQKPCCCSNKNSHHEH